MIKKLRVEHVNITIFIIVGAINLINCITLKYPLWRYIAYVLPFIAFALIQVFLNTKINRKVNAIIFLLCSIFSVAFGDRGNLTGATFLFFAIYSWGNDRFTYVTLILSLFTMVSTFVYKGYTIPQSVNYIAGYTYFMAIYFIMIHPKKPTITAPLEEETIEILQHLVAGLKPKQIADKMNMTTEAVNKQIQRARDKMEVGNNEQMVFLLSQNGQIRQ
jgi:DNA-binding CsgD family transcriptional regulator